MLPALDMLARRRASGDTRRHLFDPGSLMNAAYRRVGGERLFAVAAILLLLARNTMAAQGTPPAQTPAPVANSISVRTTGYDKLEGFIPLFLDSRGGKILMELPRDT